MYILSALPSRAPADRKLVREVYLRALRGVTRHSLNVAVDDIIQGHSGLTHGFMPSPPELRRECERIMQPIIDRLAYQQELRAQQAEILEFRKRRGERDHLKGRAVVATGIDHLTWLAKRKEYPTGALWVAKTATVYGPIQRSA